MPKFCINSLFLRIRMFNPLYSHRVRCPNNVAWPVSVSNTSEGTAPHLELSWKKIPYGDFGFPRIFKTLSNVSLYNRTRI